MQKYIEKVEKLKAPVVALRGITIFPSAPVSFEISNEVCIKSCERAGANDGVIFAVGEKDISSDVCEPENLFVTGCVAKLKQIVRLPEGGVRVFAEGFCRADALEYSFDDEKGELDADVMCKTISVENNGGVRGEALVLEINSVFDDFVQFIPKMSKELTVAVKTIKNPGMLADFIACNVLISPDDRRAVLEEYNPIKRAELVCEMMEREYDVLVTEKNIRAKVRERIDANQREFYLKEQLKAVKDELGMEDEADSEIDEYYDKIAEAKLPKEVAEKLNSEVRKLAKTPYASSESCVIRNYLDLCLELPWTKVSRECVDVDAAKKILDRDHDGLDKVKERILEYIAVKQLSPDLKNQIICLVGAPGTGKTSIAASIARALKRKYVRVSLGGVRDEADIRGHRKTYVAAMPGRIVDALRRAGVKNPLILLDEVDKLTSDMHGDPSSALLEVLDSEQNKSFRDHFVEMPVDLSDCMFVATANDISRIPRPLLDRMEVIELPIYTRNEKLSIAKNHLVPKQLKRHGLTKREVKISNDAILEIIDSYTSEAGVRNLEREIASICRKCARKIVESHGECTSVSVKKGDVAGLLGPKKIIPESIPEKDLVGVVNGLAYTEVGGDLLAVEAASMPGSGKVELTGSLGDVMKESAMAAISYIRCHAGDLGIADDFYSKRDIHIHVPEGAVPKDGPSAGVTIITALASELSGRPVRRDVAMTGEVTLRGRVLPIGGLREKTMAAYKAKVKTVIIPKENVRDLVDIDPAVKDALEFIPCSDVSEVLDHAIVK